MSAEIVNLRRVRKAAARAGRDGEAAANRAKHGRTKAERAAERMESERAARVVDGARRDTGAAPGDGS